MGPRKEWHAGQRTFLFLMLIAVVLFGVHFESDRNGYTLVSNLPAFLDSRSVERLIDLQYSIASIVKRPFSYTIWDKNLVMRKFFLKVGVFDCAKAIQDWRF